MKPGKLPPSLLQTQVLSRLGVRRPDVLVHAALGEDSAVVDFGESVCVISADPITGAVSDMGWLGVQVACNDVAANGAEPIGVLATLLLPTDSPDDLPARIMADLHSAAVDLGIEILGGHTEVTAAVNSPVLAMTALGRAPAGGFLTSAGARSGDQVLMTKWAGLEGTAILAADFPAPVRSLLGDELYQAALNLGRQISVLPEARLATARGATALHDATEGGILGAIWEMAEGAGLGVRIDRASIPVHPATRRLAEHLRFDPLALISSGALLIAAPPTADLATRLHEAGLAAAAIGVFTGEPDREIVAAGQREPLRPPHGDELWGLIERLTDHDRVDSDRPSRQA